MNVNEKTKPDTYTEHRKPKKRTPKKKRGIIMSATNFYLYKFPSRFMSSQCTEEQYVIAILVKRFILVPQFSSDFFFFLIRTAK